MAVDWSTEWFTSIVWIIGVTIASAVGCGLIGWFLARTDDVGTTVRAPDRPVLHPAGPAGLAAAGHSRAAAPADDRPGAAQRAALLLEQRPVDGAAAARHLGVHPLSRHLRGPRDDLRGDHAGGVLRPATARDPVVVVADRPHRRRLARRHRLPPRPVHPRSRRQPGPAHPGGHRHLPGDDGDAGGGCRQRAGVAGVVHDHPVAAVRAARRARRRAPPGDDVRRVPLRHRRHRDRLPDRPPADPAELPERAASAPRSATRWSGSGTAPRASPSTGASRSSGPPCRRGSPPSSATPGPSSSGT